MGKVLPAMVSSILTERHADLRSGATARAGHEAQLAVGTVATGRTRAATAQVRIPDHAGSTLLHVGAAVPRSVGIAARVWSLIAGIPALADSRLGSR